MMIICSMRPARYPTGWYTIHTFMSHLWAEVDSQGVIFERVERRIVNQPPDDMNWLEAKRWFTQ